MPLESWYFSLFFFSSCCCLSGPWLKNRDTNVRACKQQNYASVAWNKIHLTHNITCGERKEEREHLCSGSRIITIWKTLSKTATYLPKRPSWLPYCVLPQTVLALASSPVPSVKRTGLDWSNFTFSIISTTPEPVLQQANVNFMMEPQKVQSS